MQMGEKTGISWCDHTFNPWTHWAEPLKWNAAANKAGVRRKVFCGSMCDVFEGAAELHVPRERLWQLIGQTPALDWLLCTKRPENIRNLTPALWWQRRASAQDGRWYPWPDNVWTLATVENQDVLESRTAPLLEVPGLIVGVSLEPLLGPVRMAIQMGCRWEPGLRQICHQRCLEGEICELTKFPASLRERGVDWIILGCEKLAGNRPGRRCELAAVRDLVAQGRAAGVAVFVKQLEIDGRVSADPADWPEDLRVQEFPKAT